MKTLSMLLAACAVCVCSPVRGAPDSPVTAPIKDDYVNLLRIDLRATKAEIVTNSLELTSTELATFWPIYREFDQEMAELDTERIGTLREFSAHYSNIDDVRAEELTRASFEFQKRRLALLEKYYAKVAKSFNAATAARFVQVEHQMIMLVDVQIASEIPLIPRKALVEGLKVN